MLMRDNAADLACRTSRVWVEIDKQRVKSNLCSIKKFVSPCQVLAVLKADAYGMGLMLIGEILNAAGVDSFGVAEVSAAEQLKSFGRPVHLLGALLEDEVEPVVRAGFIAPIGGVAEAVALSREATRQERVAYGQIVVDSGMGRLGVRVDKAVDLVREISSLSGLRLVGLYSHFPSASQEPLFATKQVEAVSRVLGSRELRGLRLRWRHIANSEGVHHVRRSRRSPFNLVRTGISLYGLGGFESELSKQLASAVTLKTRVIAIRDLPKGASVGYGRSFTLTRPTRVGTLSAGYADGLPMELANVREVKLGGARCKVIGAVSMDFLTIDLTDVRGANVGDEIELATGREFQDWAQVSGVPPHSLVCSLGNRVRRVCI